MAEVKEPPAEGTKEEEEARIAEYAKEWGDQYARWLRACELGKPFGDTIGDDPGCAIYIPSGKLGPNQAG